jgi:two-component system, NarL family, nitrate/nitrite response regulator NarL
MNKPIRLMIADDHQLFIEGLKLLLRDDQDMNIVAEALDGLSVLEQLKNVLPDILIMDINMPKMDGIDTLKRIREYYPAVKTLILSTYNEPSFTNELVKNGASGFITKNTSYKDLTEAINTIFNGNPYFPQTRHYAQTAIEGTDSYLKLKQLTPREKEILRLIVQGKMNKEISSELFLSIFTIETHRKNIQRKLQAKNAADLVRIGMSLD